jgi:hypothetical protein
MIRDNARPFQARPDSKEASMTRSALVAIATMSLVGCAVVKTTDVTDSAYKRHQSVSVLGWPLYSRVTDGPRHESTPRGLESPDDHTLPAAAEQVERVELPEYEGGFRR